MVVLLFVFLFQRHIETLHHDKIVVLLDAMRVDSGEVFEFLQLLQNAGFFLEEAAAGGTAHFFEFDGILNLILYLVLRVLMVG